MNEKELLLALRDIVKEEVQPINTRLDKMDTDINGMKADISELKEQTAKIETRTTKIEVTLENVTNKNIQLLMEGHKGLVDNIHEIQKDTDRIEKIETRLFAAEAVAKDNVENIKKLQPKRKI